MATSFKNCGVREVKKETLSLVIEGWAELGRPGEGPGYSRGSGFYPESCVVHLKGELEVWSVELEQMRNKAMKNVQPRDLWSQQFSTFEQ